MAYYPNQGGGKGLLVFIIIIIIVGGVLFAAFGSKYALTRNLHAKIFGGEFTTKEGLSTYYGKVVGSSSIIIPPSENYWCKIQEIDPGENRENPTRIQIIGWDSVEDACVKQITGYNCALKRNSILQYAYTSNIGGEILYVTIEGYYVKKEYMKEVIEEFDKEAIPNKYCDISKYPVQVIENV